MNHLKKFESFITPDTQLGDFRSNFDQIFDIYNKSYDIEIIDYNVSDDDNILYLNITSGNDRSDNCPKIIKYKILFNDDENSYQIKRLNDNKELGTYDTESAISIIQFSYRDYE